MDTVGGCRWPWRKGPTLTTLLAPGQSLGGGAEQCHRAVTVGWHGAGRWDGACRRWWGGLGTPMGPWSGSCRGFSAASTVTVSHVMQ